MNDMSIETLMSYVLHILALFGLVFVLILLTKLTLWCLQCNLDSPKQVAINRYDVSSQSRRKMQNLHKRSVKQELPPKPPTPTYDSEEAKEEPTYVKLAFPEPEVQNSIKQCCCPFCSPPPPLTPDYEEPDKSLEIEETAAANEPVEEVKIVLQEEIASPEERPAENQAEQSVVHRLVEVTIEPTQTSEVKIENVELENRRESSQSIETSEVLKVLDDTIEEMEQLNEEMDHLVTGEEKVAQEEVKNEVVSRAEVVDSIAKTNGDIQHGQETTKLVMDEKTPQVPQCAIYAKVIDQIKKRNVLSESATT